MIDAYIMVRPDVIAALGKLARGAANFDARADAARAIGILRGRDAVPDLIEALHSKDDKLMYESLVAMQKIGDPTAAPRVTFLLRDLEEKIQVQALETVGLLRDRSAAPDVRDALQHARSVRVRRAALEALAMIADPADRTLFLNNLKDQRRRCARGGCGRPGACAQSHRPDGSGAGLQRRTRNESAAFGGVRAGGAGAVEHGPVRTAALSGQRAEPAAMFMCIYLVRLVLLPAPCAIVTNDLAALDAIEDDLTAVRKGLDEAVDLDPSCEPARLNLSLLFSLGFQYCRRAAPGSSRPAAHGI